MLHVFIASQHHQLTKKFVTQSGTMRPDKQPPLAGNTVCSRPSQDQDRKCKTKAKQGRDASRPRQGRGSKNLPRGCFKAKHCLEDYIIVFKCQVCDHSTKPLRLLSKFSESTTVETLVYNLRSSAYSLHKHPLSNKFAISLTYKMNNSGPPQPPWITLLFILIKGDTESPTLLHCDLSINRLSIHFNKLPDSISSKFIAQFAMTHTVKRFRKINIGSSQWLFIRNRKRPIIQTVQYIGYYLSVGSNWKRTNAKVSTIDSKISY